MRKQKIFFSFLMITVSCILYSCNANKKLSENATTTKETAVVTTPSTTTPIAADKRGYIVKVGDKSPDLNMVLADDKGTKVSSKDWKDKVVMLQFTASWCGVCRKEMPFIEEEIWKKHKDSGDFVLIGIDRDEPLEKVQAFAEKIGVTYPLALDPNADIFGQFATKKSGVTRNIIIDKKGNIAYLTRLFERGEFDEMKEKIEELLVH